jgi:hypothetical protein
VLSGGTTWRVRRPISPGPGPHRPDRARPWEGHSRHAAARGSSTGTLGPWLELCGVADTVGGAQGSPGARLRRPAPLRIVPVDDAVAHVGEPAQFPEVIALAAPSLLVLGVFPDVVRSTLWMAVKHGRRGLGCELKPSYWQTAVNNLTGLEAEMGVPMVMGMPS